MSHLPIQIYIVDDDPSIRVAYARLMRSAKLRPRAFASVEEFIGADFVAENACVVSDVNFPGKSGLELPALLEQAGHRLPVIFVTAHDTPATHELAARCGAEYFRKPVHDEELLEAIARALERRRKS